MVPDRDAAYDSATPAGQEGSGREFQQAARPTECPCQAGPHNQELDRSFKMSDWFRTLAAGSELPVDAVSELRERGFVVLRDAVASDRMERLANAYTEAIALATDVDIRIGSASTRVNDFVNRGSAFDDLYYS